MKLKVFTLLIISTILAGFATLTVGQSPAMAQNRGARFTFAPNVYRMESHPKPRSAWSGPQPQHKVAHGRVPQGSSFLGVSPSMLKSSSPAHKPLTRSTANGSIKTASTKASYQKHFGKPTALVANQSPAIKSPKPTAKKSVSAKVASRKVAKRSVSARRVKHKPHNTPARVAKANHIKGYGNNFFTPGGHTPTSTGSRASTSVKGRVIHR